MIIGRAVVIAPAVWIFFAAHNIDSWGLVSIAALGFALVTSLGNNRRLV
jgi:hypothetical protein